MLRFLIVRVLLPAAAVALVFMAISDGVPSLILGWGLLGYLAFRAWPAVRQDWLTLWGLLPKGGAHGGGLRIDRARSGDL